jgi:hypothetical protein
MVARVVFALVGVVCVALGAGLISMTRDLLQHGVRTTGIVVAYHRSEYKHSPTHSPQVRYVGTTNQAGRRRIQDGLYRAHPSPAVAIPAASRHQRARQPEDHLRGCNLKPYIEIAR